MTTDVLMSLKESVLVILGAAASGQDICLEVSTKAEIVYFSHKCNVPSKLPDNVKQQRSISFVSTDGTVHFDDGQQRKADAILLCTVMSFRFHSSVMHAVLRCAITE